MLKPQDIVVLLWMCAHPGVNWTYASIAAALRMSSSEVHAGLQRAARAGLYAEDERRPVRAALREFLVHGVRYAFAPRRLGFTRGVPTSHAAPGLSGRVLASDGEPPPVWPHPDGETRGEGIEPALQVGSRCRARRRSVVSPAGVDRCSAHRACAGTQSRAGAARKGAAS